MVQDPSLCRLEVLFALSFRFESLTGRRIRALLRLDLCTPPRGCRQIHTLDATMIGKFHCIQQIPTRV